MPDPPAFYGLLRSDFSPRWTAIALLIWMSVFNLFVISVFWSFMVDVHTTNQSERLFVTGRLNDRFGPGFSLVSLPLVTVFGFITLGLSPILIVLIIFQVVRFASNHSLSGSARERLFSPQSAGDQ